MAKILLIDDDEILRDSIQDILEEENHDITSADNPKIALQKLENEPFDIILSDVKMPEMDGLTFLKEVKDRYASTPIIMLTGHGSVASAVQAMRDGALNYLLKPANKRQLIESIEEAIHFRNNQLQQQSLIGEVVNNLRKLGITDQSIQNTIQDSMRHDAKKTTRFLKVGELIIDQHRLIAMFQGKTLELTPTEFEILYCLTEAGGRVVTFEEIVFRLQGIRTERDEARSMISTHISNLRSKLRLAKCIGYLVNSRGNGYFINFDNEYTT
jgi:DNA-binding response OmpR family regulator